MNGWRVEMTDTALRDADAVLPDDLPSILRAIRLLARDPSTADVKKLKGEPDRWRMRVGKWRVIFRFNREEHILQIQSISDRKDAY